ncbi:MAG: hypothetical protein C0516_04355 [Gemmatimonas sp.]|nr:hypothetical protein [Gemmatimonas sp.]
MRPPRPAELRPFRAQVVEALERAVERFPEVPWFHEQLIRVLVERRDFARAQRALAKCQSPSDRCTILQLYVAHAADERRRADSLVQLVSPELWSTVDLSGNPAASLIAERHLGVYLLRDRAEQRRLDSTFWWLATPFLGDEENARLIEHVARQVHNLLNRGLPLTAQHDLRLDRGADALLAVWIRYGVPKHQLPIAMNEDSGHFAFVKRRYDPPYSAMEYSRDNAAVAPTWAQVLDPLSLTDSSMALSAPRDATVDTWWPHEFFLHPRGRIVHLPASQRVWLRRDDHAVLVAATTVAGGELDALPRAPVRVVLAHSAGPAAVTQRTTQTAQPGERVVLQQRISRPGLVGVEILADSGGLAGARSRVGVREVPTLAALGPGTCALTEPALLDGAVAVDPNTPFAGLLGSTTLDRPTRMGVAWESYGFAPSDTVTVAVRLASADALSALRRAGMALRVADDPRVSVTMQWQEPDPARAGTVVPGTRPIVSRAVMLDVRQLRRGTYMLEVEMQSARCGTVTSQRELTVQR